MKKVKLICPECKNEGEVSYFKWLFTSLFHNFNFKLGKDKRLTKCPKCNKKSGIYSEKIK